jgi:hypothetical protein
MLIVALAPMGLLFRLSDGCVTVHAFLAGILAEAVQKRWRMAVEFFLNTGWFPETAEQAIRRFADASPLEVVFFSLVNVVAFAIPAIVLLRVEVTRDRFRSLLTLWGLMFFASFFLVGRRVCDSL